MTRLQFGGVWPAWLVIVVAVVGAILIWRWVWNESRYLRRPWNWLLPLLRSLAFALILLMLAGPSLHHRWIVGQLSRLVILVDESASMGMDDQTNRVDPGSSGSRLAAANSWLSDSDDNEGFLHRASENFHVQVFGVNGTEASNHARLKYDSLSNGVRSVDGIDKVQLSTNPTSPTSPIGDALEEIAQTQSVKEGTSQINRELSAVVLLTDGQSNSGSSIIDASRIFAEAKVPVFTVGYGKSSEPTDIGIVSVDHSKRVFRDDMLKGTIRVKQQCAPGTNYKLTIKRGAKSIWSKEFDSTSDGIREIEFALKADRLLEDGSSTMTSHQQAVPIDLQFKVESAVDDASPNNNTLNSSLWGVVRKSRVLLVDKRGRWETRYIKNAYSRDSTWDIKTHLGPTEYAQGPFPSTKEAFFDFDLMVLAIEAVHDMSDSQLKWFDDYVSQSGGGVIFIDGNRPTGTDAIVSKLEGMLPVTIDQNSAPLKVDRIQLTSLNSSERAFFLSKEPERNEELWKSLPPPRTSHKCKVAPGASVFVEGTIMDGEAVPLIATRMYGQGRVAYIANDETWRWRYQVADLYHQRFWSQIGQWVMRMPFAAKNDFAALDSGQMTYEPEDEVELRVRLKSEEGRPLVQGKVNAILLRDDVRYATIPMLEQDEVPGFYSAVASKLLPGHYQVRVEAAGMPSNALDLKTEFKVQSLPDIELQSLACNTSALEQISSMTGGKYHSSQAID